MKACMFALGGSVTFGQSASHVPLHAQYVTPSSLDVCSISFTWSLIRSSWR